MDWPQGTMQVSPSLAQRAAEVDHLTTESDHLRRARLMTTASRYPAVAMATIAKLGGTEGAASLSSRPAHSSATARPVEIARPRYGRSVSSSAVPAGAAIRAGGRSDTTDWGRP